MELIEKLIQVHPEIRKYELSMVNIGQKSIKYLINHLSHSAISIPLLIKMDFKNTPISILYFLPILS